MADLALLPITVDSKQIGSLAPIIGAPSPHIFDAAYLELALRRALPLASLDAELRLAAQGEGVI